MALPTIPLAEVQTHKSSRSCYVTLGPNVYDVTEFVESHPGGADLILDQAGTDVKEMMEDEYSHKHSEAAYDILQDHLIGYLATEPIIDAATASNHPDDIVPLPPSANGTKQVFEATGMSCAEDLSRETDFSSDYKTHKFLDLSRPLLMQVWNGGFSKEFYLAQVHRPRHYKGGDSAPLFGNFLEPLSKTAWYIVPIVWLPPVAYGTWLSLNGLESGLSTAAYWALGLGIWTLVEYVLHRFLFHLDG
jgi:4-hydroxysphinganine ceramide fatty acyl 2-hydroxylase